MGEPLQASAACASASTAAAQFCARASCGPSSRYNMHLFSRLYSRRTYYFVPKELYQLRVTPKNNAKCSKTASLTKVVSRAFVRGRLGNFELLFLTERVTYQELPQNNAKCTKKGRQNWGAKRPILLMRPFCCILRYLGVTLGRYLFQYKIVGYSTCTGEKQP